VIRYIDDDIDIVIDSFLEYIDKCTTKGEKVLNLYLLLYLITLNTLSRSPLD